LRGGIVSEANAFGKARGYADGDTTIGKVEFSVAMHRSYQIEKRE
jgi:hypothetical protein